MTPNYLVVFYGCLFQEYFHDMTPIYGPDFYPISGDISWWIVPGTLNLED